MSKKKQDQEPPKPKTRLYLSMREFSFFSKDTEAVLDELQTIIDSGHILKLEMTQSTSLSADLYTLNLFACSKGYDMGYRYDKDQYKKAQVIVILSKEVSE